MQAGQRLEATRQEASAHAQFRTTADPEDRGIVNWPGMLLTHAHSALHISEMLQVSHSVSGPHAPHGTRAGSVWARACEAPRRILAPRIHGNPPRGARPRRSLGSWAARPQHPQRGYLDLRTGHLQQHPAPPPVHRCRQRRLCWGMGRRYVSNVALRRVVMPFRVVAQG